MTRSQEIKAFENYIRHYLNECSIWDASSHSRFRLEQSWLRDRDFRIYIQGHKPEINSYMIQTFYDSIRYGSVRSLGSYVHRSARQRIRRTTNITNFSKPGESPKTRSGKLKKTIRTAEDPKTGAVYIGPTGDSSSTVPGVLERGGTTTLSKTWRERTYQVGDWGPIWVSGEKTQGRYSQGWKNRLLGEMRHTDEFWANHPSPTRQEQQVAGWDETGKMTRYWVVRRPLISAAMAQRAMRLHNETILKGRFVTGETYVLQARPYMAPALETARADFIVKSGRF